MEVIYDLFALKGQVAPGTAHVVTIGNFDGVHAGHKRLVTATCEKADRLGIASAAVTFDPHPLQVIAGNTSPSLITSLPRKLELLAELGLDRVFVLPFTRSIADLTPAEFVHSILLEGLYAKELVIGYDYALGKGRRGNYLMLLQMGKECGFGVEQVAPVLVEGEIVSSSRIRNLLREGNVAALPPLLGRFHSIDGTITHGQGRGAGLGFPTANISIGDVLLPMPGVYATFAELAPAPNGQKGMLMGVTNIGTNPTFGGTSLSLETHLLDFSRDIYGMTMRLHFVSHLRGEQHFATVDALKQQIATDAGIARHVLAAPNIG